MSRSALVREAKERPYQTTLRSQSVMLKFLGWKTAAGTKQVWINFSIMGAEG